MLALRTPLVAVLALAALALSVPVKRQDDNFPGEFGFPGTFTVFDPVNGDDCNCGLNATSLAVKVPLSTVSIVPTSPLCECVVDGDPSTGGSLAFNKQVIAPAISVVGFCETCGPNDFQASPAALKAMGGNGRSPVSGLIQVGL